MIDALRGAQPWGEVLVFAAHIVDAALSPLASTPSSSACRP
jgi:hypothetical protein